MKPKQREQRDELNATLDIDDLEKYKQTIFPSYILMKDCCNLFFKWGEKIYGTWEDYFARDRGPVQDNMFG